MQAITDTSSFSTWCERKSTLAALVLGLSIPISVALNNLLLAILLLLFLLGGRYRHKWQVIRGNPVALAALALYAWMLVAAFYGPGTWSDARMYLGKYIDLLFIGILLPLFANPRTRSLAFAAIGTALGITLLASFLGVLGIISGRPDMDNPALVFRSQITQNLFLGYFAFALLVSAQFGMQGRRKLVFRMLAGLAILNVLFFGQGRTGYLTVLILSLLFFFSIFRWRGLIAVVIMTSLVGGIAYSTSSSLSSRVLEAFEEVQGWQPGKMDLNSSMGTRLEFYYNSLAIIREHPIMGVGTGGLQVAYRKQLHDSAEPSTRNPHNEYLLVAAQQGIVGLGLLLALFAAQWRMTGQLAAPANILLARGLVLVTVAGCLFNSLLLDHTEGLCFAWMSALLFSAPHRRKGEMAA